MTVYQRHGEGACSSAVSQVTDALPFHNRYYHVLHAICCTWWTAALGPWFKQAKNPYPLNHDVSVATSGSFFGREAGKV